MPDVGGPFDGVTWQQAQWYRDAWARELSGVYGTVFGAPGSGDLPLTVSGLTATMGLGRAHVRGAGYERTGTAWSYAVPANTNANPRVDRLVLRRDLAAKTVVPLVLQGTPAVSPAAPALTQVEDGAWDLPLYQFTVPGSSGAPLTNLVDERVPADPAQGGWTAYVPVFSGTGFAIGNGVAEGRFRQHGKTVVFLLRLTVGSTTTPGTGGLLVTLPVTNLGSAWYGTALGEVYDASTGTRYYCHGELGSAAAILRTMTAPPALVPVTGAVPVALAVGDVIGISGVYEAA